MKQKDVAALILVVGVTAILSFIVAGKFISPPENRAQQVEVVQTIEAAFNTPQDKRHFNDTATNPTKLIQIAPNANGQPFVNE